MRRPIGFALLFLIGIIAVFSWPVTTRYGVDYRWSSRQIPLGEKGLDFLHRDFETRRLVREVTEGASGDEEKLKRITAWVSANVRPVPPGFPVVDDHIQNVWIRGYGTSDQRAEVFALLASYSGFSAAARTVRPTGVSAPRWGAWVRGQQGTFLFDEQDQTLVRVPESDPLAQQEIASDRMDQQRPWSRMKEKIVRLFRIKE